MGANISETCAKMIIVPNVEAGSSRLQLSLVPERRAAHA
jgi:hypothetical protein